MAQVCRLGGLPGCLQSSHCGAPRQRASHSPPRGIRQAGRQPAKTGKTAAPVGDFLDRVRQFTGGTTADGAALTLEAARARTSNAINGTFNTNVPLVRQHFAMGRAALGFASDAAFGAGTAVMKMAAAPDAPGLTAIVTDEAVKALKPAAQLAAGELSLKDLQDQQWSTVRAVYDSVTGPVKEAWKRDPLEGMTRVALEAGSIVAPFLQTANGARIAGVAGRIEGAAAVAEGVERAGPTIYLYGFRGAGKAEGLLAADAPHPYVVTGHAGYSFDGRAIYGFGPKVPEGMAVYDAVHSLKVKGTSYPGIITDDTAVFRGVADNPAMSRGGAPQVVIEQRIPVSQAQFDAVKAAHDAMGVNSPMENVRYGFPGQTECTYNCATFPSRLGIPIPEESGVLREYIPALEKVGEPWKP